MFVNELHSMLVYLGRLVVNDGRMLMCPDATTLRADMDVVDGDGGRPRWRR
jgi:hypothetical protein